jgi:hypothetical protein
MLASTWCRLGLAIRAENFYIRVDFAFFPVAKSFFCTVLTFFHVAKFHIHTDFSFCYVAKFSRQAVIIFLFI